MKKVLLLICFITGGGLLFAQTAGVIDEILDSKTINFSQASYFVLTSAGILDEKRSVEDAFTAAQANKWVSKKAEAGRPVSYGDLSLLVMRSFGLKGGIGYSITHSRRASYRELQYKQIIQGLSDSSKKITGEQMLAVIGRALDTIGDGVTEGERRRLLLEEVNASLRNDASEVQGGASSGSEGVQGYDDSFILE
jgi:hypothetical protein